MTRVDGLQLLSNRRLHLLASKMPAAAAAAEEAAAAKWRLICEQGTRVSARSDASAISDPANLDPGLLVQYQSFALSHIATTINGSANGLWFLLQVPSVFIPLVATRKSELIPCLFMRCVAFGASSACHDPIRLILAGTPRRR